MSLCEENAFDPAGAPLCVSWLSDGAGASQVAAALRVHDGRGAARRTESRRRRVQTVAGAGLENVGTFYGATFLGSERW